MDELVEWLGKQLDEDERLLGEADTSPEMVTGIPGSYAAAPVALLITEFAGPDRVRREIDFKRELLVEHANMNDGSCSTCVNGQWGYPIHGCSTPQSYPCRTLRLHAEVYDQRPGYREEWRP